MPKEPGSASSFAKVLGVRLRETSTLAAVLDLLVEAKHQCLPRALVVEILNKLAKQADSEGGTQAAIQAGEWLLESALALNGGKPLESAVTSMVRLCCASGAQRRALTLVEEAQAAGMQPRLRTLGAVLAKAAENQDRETCDRIWAEIPHKGLQPQEFEFAAMLRSLRGSPKAQYRILEQILVDRPLPSDPPLIEEIAMAFGVEGVAALRKANPPYAVGREEEGLSWHVGWTRVDSTGTCELSGCKLRALDVSTEEEEELIAYAARLANDSGSNRNFIRFQRWLAEQSPWDVIVDGANVGFNNQNREGGHFQYQQIHTLVRRLRAEGKRVLVVLHPKRLKEDADLSIQRVKRRKLRQVSPCNKEDKLPTSGSEEIDSVEKESGLHSSYDRFEDIEYPHDPITDAELEAAKDSPLDIIRTWKEWGVLLRVPVHDCDDWYWLYAALDSARRGKKHVQVVSNDTMRDHHWRMLGHRSFLRWQDRHMTRVLVWSELQDYRVVFVPPQPFSLQAQVSNDHKAWHFPVPNIKSRAEQLSSGKPVPVKQIKAAEHHWLVAWQGK